MPHIKSLTIGDETHTRGEWARLAGIPVGLLRGRLWSGWDPAAAISPLRYRPRRASDGVRGLRPEDLRTLVVEQRLDAAEPATQAVVAAALGVSPSRVGAIEKEERARRGLPATTVGRPRRTDRPGRASNGMHRLRPEDLRAIVIEQRLDAAEPVTQAVVAAALGVSPSHVGWIEREERACRGLPATSRGRPRRKAKP
jgi:DNA-binding XRE family transcriptional regulator